MSTRLLSARLPAWFLPGRPNATLRLLRYADVIYLAWRVLGPCFSSNGAVKLTRAASRCVSPGPFTFKTHQDDLTGLCHVLPWSGVEARKIVSGSTGVAACRLLFESRIWHVCTRRNLCSRLRVGSVLALSLDSAIRCSPPVALCHRFRCAEISVEHSTPCAVMMWTLDVCRSRLSSPSTATPSSACLRPLLRLPPSSRTFCPTSPFIGRVFHPCSVGWRLVLRTDSSWLARSSRYGGIPVAY